jgi:hypothetical protein
MSRRPSWAYALKWLNNCTNPSVEGPMNQKVFQPVSEMLDTGTCEPLKAAVHGTVLLLATLCAAYNTAAWLKRRQTHLAVNAVIYGATIWWEGCHVVHHLAACKPKSPCEVTRLTRAA